MSINGILKKTNCKIFSHGLHELTEIFYLIFTKYIGTASNFFLKIKLLEFIPARSFSDLVGIF
jgi:hypothetical protein